jgi:hypothetical protein
MLKLQEIMSRELRNANSFWGEPPDPPPQSPLFLFSLKFLFVVGPSTEKSLKEALTLLLFLHWCGKMFNCCFSLYK